MSALIDNIATFLAESPEWVENWLALPVKKRPTIDDSFFVVNFFKILPIEQFDKNLKINQDWYKECKRELEERRNLCIKKYWNTVEEYKKAKKALDKCWESGEVTESQYNRLYNKCCEYMFKKGEDFLAWVNIDQTCIDCGFPDLITHKNPYYYIQMYEDGLDPYEVPSPEAVEAWNRGDIEDFDEYEHDSEDE